LETYLRLARCGDQPLVDLLRRPLDPAFAPVAELLTQSEHPEVIRLVLSFLAQAQPPAAIAKVVSRRTDLPFLQAFLQEAAGELAGSWARSVKRLDLTAWSRGAARTLAALDESCQQTAVAVLVASATPRDTAFEVLAQLLHVGRVGARCAAAEALDEFRGARANDLVQSILADTEPRVVAAAVPQLRRRGIPGALARLIAMLDSRHEIVRKAARESLGEFTFQQYVAHFDMLDEATRNNNGTLVKKVDPQTLPRLREEMKSPLRSRRLRAVAVARSLALAGETEFELSEMLQDEDHLVRAEAAALLASCRSPASAAALRRSLADHSAAVREAARKSLLARGETDLEHSADRYEGRTP
jgi:HEAT repeat protein